MVRPDSPGQEWYEAPDSWSYGEDDEDDGLIPHPELLVMAGGSGWWTADEVIEED